MLEEELQKIYVSEINLEISWFWDDGITVPARRSVKRLMSPNPACDHWLRCSVAPRSHRTLLSRFGIRERFRRGDQSAGQIKPSCPRLSVLVLCVCIVERRIRISAG